MSCTNRDIQAMLYRGRLRMIQAVLYQGDMADARRCYEFWKGFAQCAAALLSTAAETMALHDQACRPDRSCKAALARLPDHSERLSFTDMERLMRSELIHWAPEAVSNSDINAVVELQDGMGAGIKLDDEHPVAGVDVRDGACLHADSSLVDGAIVPTTNQGLSEGGAA